ALEVTDLDLTGPRTTAAFFSGTKPEYPRRMICVQGSDAHRLVNDPTRKKNFGVGDRVTEFLLPERSFGALRQLFIDEDPSKVRPLRKKAEQAFDYVQSAINDGSNIIQEFENFSSLRVKNLDTSLAHICGFLNTNGGTLYIGVSSDPTATPTGFGSVEQGKKMLEKSIAERINPPVHCTIDAQSYKGKKILRIVVPQGAEPPYALDDNKIYVRGEAETNLAVRDEIVSLAVRRGKNGSAASDKSDLHATLTPNVNESIIPKTGVEVLTPEDRKGKLFFTVRDLRNGNLVKNVTVQSARKLWQYAINKYTQDIKQLNSSEAHWEGNLSLIRKTNMGNVPRFDLAIRDGETLRLFYGVTAEGIHEDWSKVTGETD
ncbi:MAG TPA: ATP-binding protein, partial [Bellilinea sp.]|nr:ATP-binding protein [Bellilinea sp.]